MLSLLYFHINNISWKQTLAAYIIWTTSMVFARVKKIKELVVDIDDKNLTIKGEDRVKKDINPS